MLTGRSLRALRGIKGISQATLAEQAGVAPNAIADFERGKRDIRVDTALKLAAALGVKVTYELDGVTLSGP